MSAVLAELTQFMSQVSTHTITITVAVKVVWVELSLVLALRAFVVRLAVY